MSDAAPGNHPAMCCGIVEGFHRDDLVAPILQRRPEQRGEWLLSDEPPAVRHRVKVQVWTEDGGWAILTGRVVEVGDGVVVATAERTTDDEDALPGGPYRLTLRHDARMECSWVLTHAELSSFP
ncbi:hypothetical protein GobsT_46900 [Gemmata obscuriglobus]|uniref:Uncharacterized protein n=1 Tax=Gemmata obscuriglobus TaxID=114 RepID=A0A2Z3HL30_9BACT|nr:hypothetical protein [Gemmata obscuriglobus]AWM42200.1 hypothetical protein C1280_10175 [Gemmata obscuriglobus]QEG29891.1 hypothetical protein GobsT_46900 [Gemmata obscuriglobus]VTS09209.1 unnamed protein product [Gemmata obscuriglobus UQM 2246]